MEVKRIVSKLLSSNTYIICEGNDAIIIDAGAEIEEIMPVVNDSNVCGVFLTHGHYDHAMFCINYAKEFNCKIYASVNAKEYLMDPEKNYGKIFKIDDFSDFEFFDGEGTFEFDKFSIQYICCGGHSKSDVLYKIGDNLFVGDNLIGRSVGRMDLYGGDKIETIQTLNKLLNTDYKIMYAGHGEEFEKDKQDKVIKSWIRFLGER